MSKKKRFILVTILTILVVALFTIFVLATINYASSKKANAEFTDISSNDIVTFNQLCTIVGTYTVQKSSGTEGGYNFGTLANINSIAWNSTHHYYMSCYYTNTSVSYVRLFFNGWGVGYNVKPGEPIIVTGITSQNIARCYGTFTSNFTDFFAVNIIDLDYMFGSENVPNLAQCEQLFGDRYYKYNPGQTMFFGLNQQDTLQNIDYYFNTGNLTGYSQNVTNSTVTYNNNSQLVLNSRAQDNYSAYYLFNFKTNVPKGSIITLYFNSYTSVSGNGNSICYANGDQELITQIPYSSNNNSPFIYSFSNNRDISSLFLIIDTMAFTSGTTNTNMTISDAYITVQFANDFKFDLQSSYDLGYQEAETYYTEGYGHTIVWGEGYDFGYSKGLEDGTLKDGWTFIGTMFNGITAVFSLEIFPNVTVGTFVLIPLLLGLIFFIVKLSRGGS